MFGFNTILKVDPQEMVQVSVIHALDHAHLPSQGARRKSHGADGMPHIVVAVTKGAFTVFP